MPLGSDRQVHVTAASEDPASDAMHRPDLFRDTVFPSCFFLGLAVFWTLQSSWMLHTVRRKEIRIRRWKFGCPRDPSAPGDAASPPPWSSTFRSGSFLHLADSRRCGAASLFCVKLRRLPFEGVAKVVFAAVAVTAELPASGDRMSERVFRATVYFFFGLSGFVDIMRHYRMLYPRGTEYFVLGMAFAVEALLHHRAPRGSADGALSDQLTGLLVWAVVACAAVTFVEMLLPQRPSLRLVRCFFTFLQGSWLVQRGVLLAGAPWLSEDPESRAPWIAVLFCCHLAGIFACMSLLVAATVCVKRKLSRTVRRFPGGPSSRTCSSPEADGDGSRHTLGDECEETAPLQP